MVSAFYVGLAALQVGDDVRAESNLARSTELAPGEPAGWVNWGILALRQRNFDLAAQRLDNAHRLTPNDDRIYYLLGILEGSRGDTAKAIVDLQQAVSLNPQNARAIYQLALEVERQGDADSASHFESLIKDLLKARPGNLAAMLELCRIAAKQSDTTVLHKTIADISAQSTTWPDDAKQQLISLQAAAETDPRSAATRTAFLRNVLMRDPAFRVSYAAIRAQPGEESQPFIRFVKMRSPPATPAAPDLAMTFHTEAIPDLANQSWNWIGAVSLTSEGNPAIVEANAHTVHLSTGADFPFPSGHTLTPPSPDGILAVDFNYDFKNDLVLAGAGGVRFLRQDSPAYFTDVTSDTRLPKSVLEGNYSGAWAVDIEADGDMDIVLGSPTDRPLVLRNNGDGTFTAIHPFPNISGMTQFVWADLNGDGNPDAALIDGRGALHVFLNERSANFREQALTLGVSQLSAISAADIGGAGIMSLLCVQMEGHIAALSADGGKWNVVRIAEVPDAINLKAGQARLLVGDLDNNGALDLILSSVDPRQASITAIWLGGANSSFQLMPLKTAPLATLDVADTGGNGKLTLLGLTADGMAMRAASSTSKQYHWQTIRPRARVTTGDQRINPFGIGGEIELRAGLLVQKQRITGPELHFGLGDQTAADVARILWPNGSVRAEFALKADQTIMTEQRLKGSCPFLFAFNGREMEFVKDAVPWGAAIGLRINAIGSADINATQEWYKIGSDQLVSHDGYYDIRITGELWETYYYDYLSLLTVDHPSGTEIYTDERFVVPAVTPSIITTGHPHAIAQAVDDSGSDVTDTLRYLDGHYLDNFGRGQYQGVTRDHYVEVDLGPDVPVKGPLWLIAQGWLHPSDSSINVALSQGRHERPRPLSMEVLNGNGKWETVRANLGFPAGRNKTCLVDISNVFRPGAPRRLRLRTNLEIYWDSITWAVGLPSAPIRVTKLAPAMADLHYRGYSAISQVNSSSPELPQYNHLSSTTQIWRDLSGFYTRYGDVRQLLSSIDDRYVLMNAGDEISLRFPAPPAPAVGWIRDYVIAGDGWIKDGDYNSTHSETVLPLPYHSRKNYDAPPGTLEDEWLYKQHRDDWSLYHTRYITSDSFRNALHGEALK
ncbi:MAG TPA: FG-GAP-like repeat-containing protein [Acidisarcina sp.]